MGCVAFKSDNGLLSEVIVQKQTTGNRVKQEQTIIETLVKLKCCEKMQESQVKKAAGVFAIGTVMEGQTVFRQGDRADCFYIIGTNSVYMHLFGFNLCACSAVSGSVEVRAINADKKEVVLGTMFPMEAFGEVILMSCS